MNTNPDFYPNPLLRQRLEEIFTHNAGKIIGYPGPRDYPGQCESLVKFVISKLTGKPVGHLGDAYHLWTDKTLVEFCGTVPAGDRIEFGDIAIWGQGLSPTGHCAFVVNLPTDRQPEWVSVYEQDPDDPNKGALHQRNRSTHHILGYLRLRPELIVGSQDQRDAERYAQAFPAQPSPTLQHAINQGLLRSKPNISKEAQQLAINKPPHFKPTVPAFVPQSPTQRHLADVTQRGAKVFGLATIVSGITALQTDFKEQELALENFHLGEPVVIVGAVLLIFLPLLYKLARIQVENGSSSLFFKVIVKWFGSARHAENEINPYIQELFKV